MRIDAFKLTAEIMLCSGKSWKAEYEEELKSIDEQLQKYRAYYEQYLAAAPVHHVGVAGFKTTWTSEVEREVLGYR